MTQTGGLGSVTHTLTFWLKGWTQRVKLKATVEFQPLGGPSPPVLAPTADAVREALAARVRACFEREVDERRWDVSDFDGATARVRADFDAWMCARGCVIRDLRVEREPDSPHGPRVTTRALQCRVGLLDGAVDVALDCVLVRRSAAAWEATRHDDLGRWAAEVLQALCWEHIPAKPCDELRGSLPRLRRAIEEDFRSRVIEVGHDPGSITTRIEVRPRCGQNDSRESSRGELAPGFGCESST